MKKVILTIDYEVFLGKSGSIDKCLIQPTNDLLALFQKEGISGVFFVDVLFLMRLKEQGLVDDYQKLKNNIHSILRAGSKIELHIHPHWIDAKYIEKDNQWDLSDDKNYRVESLSEEKRVKLFDWGVNELNSICSEVSPGYKLSAFRAGGLCIQPFEVFKSILEKHNILIESSVALGLQEDSPTHKFNFLEAKEREPYRFTSDPMVKNKKGDFIQFPLFSYKISFLSKIFLKLKGISPIHKTFGDGKSTVSQTEEVESRSLFDKSKSSIHLYSLDGDFYADLFYKKLLKEKAEVITLICHSKLISAASIQFIKKLSDSQEFIFSTFEEEAEGL